MTLETVKNDPDYAEEEPCKYNPEGVVCPKSGRKCWKCGWNPAVERQRMKKEAPS